MRQALEKEVRDAEASLDHGKWVRAIRRLWAWYPSSRPRVLYVSQGLYDLLANGNINGSLANLGGDADLIVNRTAIEVRK